MEPDISEDNVASIFSPEDEGDISLRNVGLSLHCMVLQPIRLYSSKQLPVHKLCKRKSIYRLFRKYAPFSHGVAWRLNRRMEKITH
jgi:hypothetical protein